MLGLLIIWAKMSDIFGRKPLLIAALLLFVIFSGACGGSQTFVELSVPPESYTGLALA